MSYYRGRSKGSSFVMIEKRTLQSKEFNDLSHNAQLIYIKIKANFSGFNVGEIPFSYRKDGRGFSSATIARCLKELISKRWIEKTEYGGLHRHYCLYGLTGNYDRIHLPGSKKARRSRRYINPQPQFLKSAALNSEITHDQKGVVGEKHDTNIEAKGEEANRSQLDAIQRIGCHRSPLNA